MKEVVGLRANIYSYLIDNGVRIDIRKCSTKNVQKQLNMKINNLSRQNKVYAYSLKKEHSIKISTKQKKAKNIMY